MTGRNFDKQQDAMQPTSIILTADIIIEMGGGKIIFIQRKNDPFKGQWAIPGGIMEEHETIQETAVREAKEETGLDVKLTRIIGIYSKPGRDPRGRYVSVAFAAVPLAGRPQADSDASEILVTSDFSELPLAFDHKEILTDYIATTR